MRTLGSSDPKFRAMSAKLSEAITGWVFDAIADTTEARVALSLDATKGLSTAFGDVVLVVARQGEQLGRMQHRREQPHRSGVAFGSVANLRTFDQREQVAGPKVHQPATLRLTVQNAVADTVFRLKSNKLHRSISTRRLFAADWRAARITSSAARAS